MSDIDKWDPARTETAIRGITTEEDLPGELAGHRVVIQVGDPPNANCQHALFNTINLLARLDTILDEIDIVLNQDVDRCVFHPQVQDGTVAESVRAVASRIGSPVQVNLTCEPDDPYDASVHLGDTEPDPTSFTVRIGSDGWLARVATTDGAAVSFTEKTNPVGAYLAGCMASAEVFKHALQQASGDTLKVPVEHVEDVVFSALDYSVNSKNPPNPELPTPMDVDRLHVFGVGAGGGALVHVLSAVDEAVGEVQLVDSDEVSRTNLNRYIWAFADDVDAMKTEIGQRLLANAHAGLQVESHPMPYKTFAESADSDTFDLVVSTVDSAAAREEIQWDFPRTILDAATNQQGFYVVSRVLFGDTQCLGCKHTQREDGKDRELVIVANRIGLSTDTVQRMDTDNAAFTEEQVETITAHAGEDRDFTIPEVGERFSDWFGEQCGHMDLSSAADPVPAPFLPVTAGVLLAGEVIKDRYFPEHLVDSKFTHNMFYQPRERLHSFTGPDDECSICQTERVVEHYESKWGES